MWSVLKIHPVDGFRRLWQRIAAVARLAFQRSRDVEELPKPQMIVSAAAGIELHHNSFDSLYQDIFDDGDVALDEPHPDGSCTGELKDDLVPPPLVGCSSLNTNMAVPIDYPQCLMIGDHQAGNDQHCI